jgi:hypothetical protein
MAQTYLNQIEQVLDMVTNYQQINSNSDLYKLLMILKGFDQEIREDIWFKIEQNELAADTDKLILMLSNEIRAYAAA